MHDKLHYDIITGIQKIHIAWVILHAYFVGTNAIKNAEHTVSSIHPGCPRKFVPYTTILQLPNTKRCLNVI